MGLLLIRELQFSASLNMDDKDTKKGEETHEEIKRMRLTLKSREVKPLEHACAEIITRKSPCGEGTNTWDRFEMRIHKRVIDIMCPVTVIKDITAFRMAACVDIQLAVLEAE